MENYEQEHGEKIPDMKISLIEVLKLIDQFISSGSHMTDALSGDRDPKQAWKWYCKTSGQRELRSAILYEYYYKMKENKAVVDGKNNGSE